MKSKKAHGAGVRTLLSALKALLGKTNDLANEMCGLLKRFGIRLPKAVKHDSCDGVVRSTIEVDNVLAHAMLPLLGARLTLYRHFLELGRRVKRIAIHDNFFACGSQFKYSAPLASANARFRRAIKCHNKSCVVQPSGIAARLYAIYKSVFLFVAINDRRPEMKTE